MLWTKTAIEMPVLPWARCGVVRVITAGIVSHPAIIAGIHMR